MTTVLPERRTVICAPFSCNPAAGRCYDDCTVSSQCVGGQQCVAGPANGTYGLSLLNAICGADPAVAFAPRMN